MRYRRPNESSETKADQRVAVEFPMFRRLGVYVRISVFITCLGTVAADRASGQEAANGISSSHSGPTAYSGVNINQFLGATRFYSQGYTGTRALLGIIEGTVPESAHVTMDNLTEQIFGAGVPTGPQGSNHNHPTAVAHAMSGRLDDSLDSNNYFGFGISYESETWAGAISTAFNPDGSYNLTGGSIAVPYSTMMLSGIEGRTVDVINSSWWFNESSGIRFDTLGIDGLASRTGKLLVHIAGNAGPGSNTVRGLGAGYNSLTVGSVGPDSGSDPYSIVSSFSSRGPNQFAQALTPNSWTTIAAGVARRAEVDLVAPGQSLTLALPSSGPTAFGAGWQGTSFAAPFVAGGAGLLVDAGRELYGSQESTDGRVLKAVLMNSARKLPDWNNGQTVQNDRVLTIQSLDFTTGAGIMDLNAAFDQYVRIEDGGRAETSDLVGTGAGDLGLVGQVGWDLGVVGNLGLNTYYFNARLERDSLFATTLTWFAERNPGDLQNFVGAGEEHLANLDLQVFEFDNLQDRNRIRVVAESASLYNVVEHLFINLQAGGYYGIDIRHTSSHWNFSGAASTKYALAWNVVPEPTSGVFVLLAIARVVVGRPKRKNRG